MMKLPFGQQLFANLPKAYLVGGSVRDLLRGAEPIDYDVVVPSAPLSFARQVSERLSGKVITLGKDRFSVHRVVSKTLTIDISQTKGDTIEADLMARDFTINSMACDLSTGKIIDHPGGVEDIKNRIVRMVSPNAFSEDPARLIRAFRMAATLDFKIDPLTLRTISEQSASVQRVAGERIWAEIERIMACQHSYHIVRDMAESKLLFQIVPELEPLRGCTQNQYHSADVFNHTLRTYRAMEDQLCTPDHFVSPMAGQFISSIPADDQVMIKLAVLLHDTGKPGKRSVDESGEVHFYGHAGLGASLSRQVCLRLRTSKRLQLRVESIIRYHQRPLCLFLARQQAGSRLKSIGRFFRQCVDLTPYILIHAIADDFGKGNLDDNEHRPRISFYNELIERYFSALTNQNVGALINGHDLKKHFNIEPSPFMGNILNSVKELQMAGALKNRDEAVNWVSQFLNRQSRNMQNKDPGSEG